MTTQLIQKDGNYAILDENKQYKETRYLTINTEYADGFVLPIEEDIIPNYNSKTEKLSSDYVVIKDKVLLIYELLPLSKNEIEVRKRPNPSGFLKQFLNSSNTELFNIFNKLIELAINNNNVKFWYDQTINASRTELYTKEGFNRSISNLILSANLSNTEKDIINNLLLQFDLEVLQ